MAANHYIPGAVPASLDDTADYPPLPESFAVPGAPPPPPQAAAPPHATDTWVMPRLTEEPAPASTPAQVAQPSTEELLRPYREERLQLRTELAAVNRDRDELKRQLAAQAGSLRELERRVQEEAERSTQARDEAAQLQGRSASLASELEARSAGLQDKLGASELQVRELEARLHELEAQLRAGEAERSELRASAEAEHSGLLARAEAERSELRASAEAERSGLLASAEAERSELRARYEGAQAELALLTREREQHAATQSDAERDRARREAALARSEDELSELHRRLAAHGEVLRRVEGQRHIFDAQLREREAMLDEAQARLREVTEARERIGADLAAAIARAEKAEQQLAQRQQPVMSPSPAPPEPPSLPEPLALPEPAAPVVDPELLNRVATLEAQLAASRAQLDTLQQKLTSAQQLERSLRAELDHESTIAHGTSAAVALPWPPATGSTAVAAPSAGATGEAPMPELAQLLVRTSGDAGIVHVLGRRTTIGRTPDNDLRIEADYVSRHHAVVLVNPERTVIEDLNSTNGVYVNGSRIIRHELLEGDVITIGATSFRFVRKPASA